MSNRINNLYEFGDFRFNADNNSLWRGNDLIQLTPKALELLSVLLEHEGEIVSKQEIFDRVWSETFVEDGVLTQNIYSIRQALETAGDENQLIENVARRGYRIKIPVTVISNTTNLGSSVQPSFAPDKKHGNFEEIRTGDIENGSFEPANHTASFAKRRFFRAKTRIFFGLAIILVAIGGFFGYRMIRTMLWNYAHPPLENIRFEKLTNFGNALSPAISPDGNFMAYVRKNRLLLKDLGSGTDVELIVPNVTNFRELQFSPDGNSIYFRDNLSSYNSAKILQISRFGGEAKVVAEKTLITFSVSPSGNEIAYIRGVPLEQKQDLIVKDLRDGKERKVLSRKYPETFYFKSALAWSPDGSKIAFVANAGANRSTKLFAADSNTGETRGIEPDRIRRFESIAWMPDGQTIIASAQDSDKNFQLWKVFYPSGYIQRITNGINSFDKISISADGKKVLALQKFESSNIWIADPKNLEEQIQITEGNNSNDGQTSMDWMDDDRIVFAASSEKNSMANLWMVNAADKVRQPITQSTDFQSDYAKVTFDQRAIYFNSNKNRVINIFRADPDGRNVSEVIKGADGLRLFPTPSPDGKFLYYLYRTRDSSSIRKLELAGRKETTLFQKPDITPAGFVSISGDGKYLGFLNLAKNEEETETNFEVAIIPTLEPTEPKLFSINSAGGFIRLGNDGSYFDYISLGDAKTAILRQNISGGEPTVILALEKSRIFNFAWSRSGKKLAISRGTRNHDAILLTNLD